MTYLREDEQPSIFLLKEGPKQSILTIFNWTGHFRAHTIVLSSLGLRETGSYAIFDVFDKKQIAVQDSNSLVVAQAAHSVRVLKIIDISGAAKAPEVRANLAGEFPYESELESRGEEQ
jgi:alpha-galactosidase